MKREFVEAWLKGREPGRPAQLLAQMSRNVSSCPPDVLEEVDSMATALGLLGLRTLANVSDAESGGDAVALELLAADAFVTYAFEAAAEEGMAVAPFVSWLVREAA